MKWTFIKVAGGGSCFSPYNLRDYKGIFYTGFYTTNSSYKITNFLEWILCKPNVSATRWIFIRYLEGTSRGLRKKKIKRR